MIREPRAHVVDPLRGVGVPVAELEPPVVIELQVIVRVDQAGKNRNVAKIANFVPPAP